MHDIVYVDSVPEYRACACAHTRTNQLVRTSSALVASPQLEDLNKEPKPTATLPTTGGVANLAMALAMAMALTVAARHAKQQGNPSCLALTAATATTCTSPTVDAATTAVDA